MKIFYISPSLIPSKSANSIHVINQVSAFQSLNYDITLFAARSIYKKKFLSSLIYQNYGIEINKIESIFSPMKRFYEFLIAFKAVFFCLKEKDIYIISRNLYASCFLSLFYNGKHVYEAHEIFKGFRLFLQKIIIKNTNIKLVAISNILSQDILKKVSINPNRINVIHDAAPNNLKVIKGKERKILLSENLFLDINFIKSFKGVCVYTGSFYQGKGIEIIQRISNKIEDVLFVVVGGTKKQVDLKIKNTKNKNIIFTGFKNYKLSLTIAACADALLMPYEKKVIIGDVSRNISMWMSPLKMFEYMALEVPIISSDLPVLKEILINNFNAILVDPENDYDWSNAIKKVLNNKEFSNVITRNAKEKIIKYHTWDIRAKKIISF